jgi:four helix bundle protein
MAKHFRELVAWQLAFELREQVLRLTKSGPAALDRRFCEQLNDSCRSVASNIAEGFGRYDPGDFARFLSIARGSLDETENHLRDGVESSYFPAVRVGPLILKGARCRSAITSLQVYLRSAAAKQKAKKNHRA